VCTISRKFYFIQAAKKGKRPTSEPEQKLRTHRSSGVSKQPRKVDRHLSLHRISPDVCTHGKVNVTPVKAKGKSLHKGKGKPGHKQHLQARVSDEDSLSECDIMDDEFDDAAPGHSDGDSGQLDEFHSAREASSGEDLRDGICDDGSSSDNSGSDDKAVRFLMHVVPSCAIKLHHV
jgi:hypothetical protein